MNGIISSKEFKELKNSGVIYERPYYLMIAPSFLTNLDSCNNNWHKFVISFENTFWLQIKSP
jgi:hypothetical protein